MTPALVCPSLLRPQSQACMLAKTWDGARDGGWQGGHLCRPRLIGPSKRRVLPCTSSHRCLARPDRATLCHGPIRSTPLDGVDVVDAQAQSNVGKNSNMLDDSRPISSVDDEMASNRAAKIHKTAAVWQPILDFALFSFSSCRR